MGRKATTVAEQKHTQDSFTRSHSIGKGKHASIAAARKPVEKKATKVK